MDRTELAIQRLLAALPSRGYDLGILHGGMQRFEAVPSYRLLRMLPYLKHRNANGGHIYLRPTGESAYTLLDDLTPAILTKVHEQGFGPAAVIETSPGNFQAWLRHAQPFSKELGTFAAKMLAIRFGADASAADWRRFGRAPGFTNRKPHHRDARGLYPFAQLLSSQGLVFPAAETFRSEVLAAHARQQQSALRTRLQFASSPQRLCISVSLARFRTAPRFAGRPAAADLAFCICAYAHGWSAEQIVCALRSDFLSRNTNRRMQDAYIRRTLTKAYRWAA